MALPRLALVDRAVLRELAAPFALAVATFTFFLLIDRLYQLTELVITRGVPLHLVVQLLVFLLPSFLAHTLPMALLVAILLVGGRMAGELEVVGWTASGVSPWRLYRPVALAALLVMVATATLTASLGPAATRRFQAQLFRILQTRAVSGLQQGVFNTSFADLTLYVEELSASQVSLRGVLVADERDPRLARIVTAREGRVLTDEAARRVTLRLLEGAVHEADVMPVGSPGDGPDARPAGGPAAPDRYRYTRFAVYDMTLTLTPAVRIAGRLDKPERSLGLGELRAELRRLHQDPATRLPFEAEFHKRLALPLAAAVFSLVGFPLAIRARRGGRSVALVGSLVIILAYYLLLTSLESLALRQRLPVAVAIWTPNVAFAGLGGVLLAATASPRRGRAFGFRWALRQRVAAWQPLGPRRSGPQWVGAGRATTFLMDRYVLRQFGEWLALGLAVGTVLFIVVDLLRTLDRFLRVKPPLHHIAEHFLFHVPMALHQGLPVILLVATIFLFLTLSRHHELTALKAAGVSLYRVSAPVLLTGLVISAGAGLFQEFMLPILSERGEEVDRVKIQGQLPRHLQSRARLWLRSGERGFYRVELLHPAAGTLHGITVLELDDRFRLKTRVDARVARWTGTAWEFVDGALREIDPDGGVVTRPFARAMVRLRERLEDFTGIQKPPATMSYRELREYVQRLTAAGFRAQRYLVDMYAKLSEPLENLIMILVAIPLALRAPRAGRLWGAGLALVIVAIYVVVDRSARALGQADLLPPLLAAWTANVVFLGLGTSLFLRART